MLLSHLGGIRHYVKKGEKSENEISEPNKSKDLPLSTREKEVYNKEKFDSISKALTLFQDDELMSKPGTEYLYTTHGWTLVCKYLALLCTNIASERYFMLQVSAVVEGAGKEEFTKQAKRFFSQLGLRFTKLDESDPIIYDRAK
jgi:serine beta-lactamase-like protein LACTB, mitochondrial